MCGASDISSNIYISYGQVSLAVISAVVAPFIDGSGSSAGPTAGRQEGAFDKL